MYHSRLENPAYAAVYIIVRGKRWINALPKSICEKVNTKTRSEFELGSQIQYFGLITIPIVVRFSVFNYVANKRVVECHVELFQ